MISAKAALFGMSAIVGLLIERKPGLPWASLGLALVLCYNITNANSTKGRNMKKNLTPPTMPLKPGADPTAALNQIYAMGRNYPDGRPHDAPRVTSPQSPPQDGSPVGWELAPKENSPAVQHRESGHAPGYDNDATGWVRGFGSKMHPHFDSGGSGFRYGKK